MPTVADTVIDNYEMNHCKLIAMVYKTELVGAIIAQRMGDEDSYHRLTDYVMEQTKCELWELVEALDIINNQEFEGENPFMVRMGVAKNMTAMLNEEKARADRLHRVYERKDWGKVAKEAFYEGRIMARQEAREMHL